MLIFMEPGIIQAITLTLIACVVELRTGLTPNALVLIGLLASAVNAIFDGEALSHVAGLGVATAVGLVFYSRGYLGGGTMKLMSVLGGLVGFACSCLMSALLLPAFFGLSVWARSSRVSCVPERPFPGSPILLAALVVSILLRPIVVSW